MTPSRRDFLKQSAAVTLGFGGLYMLFGRTHSSTPPVHAVAEGYGPLKPDPAGILDLPEGWQYRIISRWGDVMSDGLLVPGRPDGMAAFSGPDGKTLLVCNHENSPDKMKHGPWGPQLERYAGQDKMRLYDAGAHGRPCIGGTTTVVYDTRTQTMEKQFLSLAGTERNCAGGPTPWGTWISCEESIERKGNGYAQDHGYCFEVPAGVDAVVERPQPLHAMGRFNHEAVAVDPRTGIVYLTEDRPEGLLYRFLPAVPGKLSEGGRLQALAAKDEPSYDMRNWKQPHLVTPSETFQVEWIDIRDTYAADDDMRIVGFELGAARFARGEGMWYGNDAVYFACTNGGHAQKGQIFRYVPSPHEGTDGEREKPGTLRLFVEPNDGGLIDNADNLTVAPWGDLIVCEDGSGEQYVVGITPGGEIYKLARNASGDSELAGATFSPDGSTLFVNIQNEGLTLAITGPRPLHGLKGTA